MTMPEAGKRKNEVFLWWRKIAANHLYAHYRINPYIQHTLIYRREVECVDFGGNFDLAVLNLLNGL